MEEIMVFFANHVVLFSILGLVSLFGLVGYFVDQSEQKKGILNIISDNLINKNCGNNSVEFDISKFPLNQLKKLDIYINKCINSNHINNNINKQTEQTEEKEKNLMQVEELAPSELSDSDYTESLEFE